MAHHQHGPALGEDLGGASGSLLDVACGTGVVAVWASLDDTPGYAAMVALLARLFGDAVADELRAPFAIDGGRVEFARPAHIVTAVGA